MAGDFIAVDWGTTSFRAYLVDGSGRVTDEVADGNGILAVKDGAFDSALEQRLAAWDKNLPVLAAGMITSRQGWIELPYLDCPASPADMAKGLHRHVMTSGRTVHFSTGLHYASPTLRHDVMRSEETQVFGALDSGAKHFITPGTHSKWIDVEGDRITRFDTYVTGELFSVLKGHSILGRLMTGDDVDEGAFRRGVEAVLAEPAGLTHLLFSARSLGLYGVLPGEAISSYLSGLVIGAEVAHALMGRDAGADYILLASAKIGGAYASALEVAGAKVRYGDPAAIVAGLRTIGRAAGVI
jgi:2-dehydro-3-deoxygalactonokinase